MRTSLILWALAALLVSPAGAQAKRYNLILDFGEDVLVAGKDDISVRAQCVQNEGGSGFDYVRLYVVTANDSVLRGALDYHPGNGDYLTAMSSVFDGEVGYYNTPLGQEGFFGHIDGGTALNLTTMRGYVMNVESTMYGLNSGGNDCLLSVDIKEVKKFKAAL